MNKDKILKDYYPLVKSIANKYRNYGIPKEDLEQEGLIGLLEASDNFDKSRGTKFSTYASSWIKKKIISALNRENKLSISSSEILEETVADDKPSVADKSGNELIFPQDFPDQEKTVLTLLFQKQLTLKEIAGQLDLTREKVRQLKEKGLRRLKAEGIYTEVD
jgi:RNA polymerase sporulation-specific sigma factor